MKIFQKSLMALAVGACVSPAHSQTFDIAQGPVRSVGQSFDSVEVTGTAARLATSHDAEIQLIRAHVTGSVVNKATFTLDGQERTVGGIALAPGYVIGQDGAGVGGQVGGDVRNEGRITLNNVANAEGFEVGNITVGGSLVNAGDVIIHRTTDPQAFGEPEGIYLHGTQIAGDFVNSGTVQVDGDDTAGLIIDQHGRTPFTLGGQLLNSGSILVNGVESIAFDIEAQTSALKIANTGSISVQGADSKAVSLWEATIDVLDNSGEITALGDGARAVVVQDAQFTTTLPSGARGLVNSGTISATGNAIDVTTDALASGFEINQLAGRISSTEGVAIQGGGVATLNWAGGAIQGNLLNLAAVNVTGPANFQGETIESNVSVAPGGSLNLASSGGQVIGDLQVASLSAIDMHLSDATLAGTPYLRVTGTAAFASGSHITLSATPGDFTPTAEGKTYSLLSASAIQNGGLSVTSSSALLNVSSYNVGPTSVDARVTLKSDEQVGQELGNAGASVPTTGVVNTFKNNVLGGLATSDRVYQAFANATSTEQLARLGKQLAPEVSRGGVDAALAGQGATRNAINTRVDGVRGMASGDELAGTGVWVQALNSTMDQGVRDGVAGYSANASGVAVGADGKLNPYTTLGLAYAYVNANVTADTGNKTDVQGNSLALYGSWEQGNWFTQGSLAYGRNANDSRRYVGGTLAKGSYDSDVLSADALAGYGFRPAEQLLIEPRVGARYANVQVDSYREHGSSAALRNAEQRFETAEVGAGLRVGATAPLWGGTLQPEVTLMAYHDLIGDRVNQTSAFVQGGSSFALTGAKAARDTYEGTVGVNYAINALTLGASYGYQGKSGYDADTLTLKARYAF